MRADFIHGIRFRLVMAALVLLALPVLAAQFISRMEAFLRDSQEQSIAATARAVAAGLSERPSLFAAAPAKDDPGEERQRIVALFASSDPVAVANLGNAYVPSEEIERLLNNMGRRTSRMWVVDGSSRVRGLSGALREVPKRAGITSWMAPLAALVVPTPRLPVGDATQPVRSQVDRALIGVSSTLWRGTGDRDVAILSSAQPIFVGDDIMGAVIVEESTASIQILKESALENLLALTLAVVAAALTILLAFASRLTARIRRLHAEADLAIDSQGRVRGTITPTDSKDEIGDLTRTTAAVLARLKDYNAYLEAMAGRLSHELRTPVAVVRSSLDNLKAQALAADARVYVDRAGEGVDRLARLISRLSEGTRLERLMESAERERFDLAIVVSGCVEGYRAAYPGRAFEYSPPASPIWMNGVPDAFAQLLDKLVENANDFAPPDGAVRVSLAQAGNKAILAVENDGPPLPEAMVARLFDSMVSLREPEVRRSEGHLGLGLYIVKLVAEFHHGGVRAINLAGARGARFEVEVLLP